MERNLIPTQGKAIAALKKSLILFSMLLTVSLSAKADIIGEFAYDYIRLDEDGDGDEDEVGVVVTRYLGHSPKVVIPSSVVRNDGITKYKVVGIRSGAFSDCAFLTSVTIPSSVTTVAGFSNCTSLTSVSIPNTVTYIGPYTFSGCTSLASVTIPNSVTEMDCYVFKDCTSLMSVTLPNSLTYIDCSTFEGCTSLTSVTIPNSLTGFNSGSFSGCTSLTSITIPNTVTYIGDVAFRGCTSLASVNIPNSVEFIGSDAFMNCTSLTSVSIPNSVTSFGEYAFQNCTSLASVIIHSSAIGNRAFYRCTSLGTITLASTVGTIKNAFEDCLSLKTVYSYAVKPPKDNFLPFFQVKDTVIIYVPEGTKEAYSQAWDYIADIREMTSGVGELNVDSDVRPANVYNTQGMLIKAGASQADIEALSPGVYIIDGRKVLVK